MKKSKGNHLIAKTVLAGLMSAALLSGCGSSYGNYAASEAAAPSYTTDSYSKGAYDTSDLYEYDSDYAAEEAYVDNTGSGEVSAPSVQDTKRKLITTVHLTAETDDFETCVDNITARVEGLGGYVQSSDIYNGSRYYYSDYYRERRNADFVLRIPADKLNDFLGLVNDTTNITNKSQSVEDVTLDYVDMQSHKKALQTEEERLLQLLEQADNLEDMLTIESRLSDVRYQIESMESQLRTFDNKVDYSTVYLSLQEVVEYTEPDPEPPVTFWDRVTSGFIEDLERVWGNLQDFAVWFISHIPSIVVWAVIICIVVWIVRKVHNRNLTPEEIARKKEEKKQRREQKKADKKRMKEMGKNSRSDNPTDQQ